MTLPALVSTAWLADHLKDPDLRVLDASWYLPQTGRSGRYEYEQGHIPGAGFFDLDAFSDHQSPLPHMLPAPDRFAAGASALGISSADRIVVYDASGTNVSAPRAWWMFRVFGHEAVAVLDGGLTGWRKEARRLERGAPAFPLGTFIAKLDQHTVRTLPAMRRNLETHAEQVVDARSTGRFAGTEPEPRAGLRGGHIPDSRSLPYTQLTGPDGLMLPAEAIRLRFEQAGLDLNQPVVTTCGSGVTACVLAFGLHLLGYSSAVYDGSWSEWGGRPDTPVETGSHADGQG